MGFLGLISLIAVLNTAQQHDLEAREGITLEETPLLRGDVPEGLSLLGGRTLDRGDLLVIDTVVGRYELMFHSFDAQLQMGSLASPTSEAVALFAPASCFDRTEPGKGRLVLALPLIQF